MKNVLIIRGQRDAGKTTTAGLVYEELFKIAQQVTLRVQGNVIETGKLQYIDGELVDFIAVLIINDKIIVIISAGDEADYLKKAIEDNKGFHILICCTRTRNVAGSSYKLIEEELFRGRTQAFKITKAQNPNEKYSIKKPVVRGIVNEVKNQFGL